MVALAAFVDRDEAATESATRDRLRQLLRQIEGLAGVTAGLIPGRRDGALPRIAIDIRDPAGVLTADGVCRRLRRSTPPVHVGEGQIGAGRLIVDLIACCPRDDRELGDALRMALSGL